MYVRISTHHSSSIFIRTQTHTHTYTHKHTHTQTHTHTHPHTRTCTHTRSSTPTPYRTGGSTFCAIASLVLMDKLTTTLTAQQKDSLIRWCLIRQTSGFQGRPNKDADTCYSFWIGATLKVSQRSLCNHYVYIHSMYTCLPCLTTRCL